MRAYPELLSCAISQDKEVDLILTTCSHVFGQSNLSQWLQQSNTSCPICRGEFEDITANDLESRDDIDVIKVFQPMHLRGYAQIYDELLNGITSFLERTLTYGSKEIAQFDTELSTELAKELDKVDKSKVLATKFKASLLNILTTATTKYLETNQDIHQDHRKSLIQYLPNLMDRINSSVNVKLTNDATTIVIEHDTSDNVYDFISSIQDDREISHRMWWEERFGSNRPIGETTIGARIETQGDINNARLDALLRNADAAHARALQRNRDSSHVSFGNNNSSSNRRSFVDRLSARLNVAVAMFRNGR